MPIEAVTTEVQSAQLGSRAALAVAAYRSARARTGRGAAVTRLGAAEVGAPVREQTPCVPATRRLGKPGPLPHRCRHPTALSVPGTAVPSRRHESAKAPSPACPDHGRAAEPRPISAVCLSLPWCTTLPVSWAPPFLVLPQHRGGSGTVTAFAERVEPEAEGQRRTQRGASAIHAGGDREAGRVVAEPFDADLFDGADSVLTRASQKPVFSGGSAELNVPLQRLVRAIPWIRLDDPTLRHLPSSYGLRTLAGYRLGGAERRVVRRVLARSACTPASTGFLGPPPRARGPRNPRPPPRRPAGPPRGCGDFADRTYAFWRPCSTAVAGVARWGTRTVFGPWSLVGEEERSVALVASSPRRAEVWG